MDPSTTAAAHLESLVTHGKAPGLQYLVIDPSQILFEQCSGWADIGQRTPVAPTTTLMAYSMSKAITAAAVLGLVQSGRLTLDDPMERWVSHPYGSGIVIRHLLIRHLLAHMSGAPNPLPLRSVHRPEKHYSFDEAAALSTVLKAHTRLSFRRGTTYGYSNVGY